MEVKKIYMEKWFAFDLESLIAIILTAIGVYISIIIYTRIAGKRSFSKMSSFDFAMTVAVGSVIATTILSPSVNLIDGIVGLASIYCLQISIAIMRRIDFIKQIVDNSPLLLMDGPNILQENLRKARVSESDLRSKLREANVSSLKEVLAVVFETTGDISVIHKEASETTLDDWLLKDVNRT